MNARWRSAIIGLLSGLVILAAPVKAGAAVGISVPEAVNLGVRPTGAGTLSAQLGTVTATASGILFVVGPSFIATVSSSDFTTGGGTSAETIPKASISYWSGPVTDSTSTQAAVPGQLTAAQAVSLSVSRRAFSSSALLGSISTSWNPTVVVTIPAAAIAGSYTATITHSVA